MKEESFLDSTRNVREISLVQFNVRGVAEKLLELKLFTKEETVEILSKEKDLDQKRSLISTLKSKGPQGIRQFAKAAKVLKITKLCEILRPALDSLGGEESEDIEEETLEQASRFDTADGHGSGKPIPKEASETENAKTRKRQRENVGKSTEDSEPKRKVYEDLRRGYEIWKKNKRGSMLLINNEDFSPSKEPKDEKDKNEEEKIEFDNRVGSDFDRDAIENLFSGLGFEVEPYNNLTLDEMEGRLEKAGTKSYSGVGCFALCILSHGGEGVIYGIDGYALKLRKITEYFLKNESLVGKPKLFFFQACQGQKYMTSATVVADGPVDDVPTKSIEMSVPVEADFLYAYSTVPGFYAWRNRNEGSWFIQAICNVFGYHAEKMDILHMLTLVNQEVSEKKAKSKEASESRQIPSIVSQLRYVFYFSPQLP